MAYMKDMSSAGQALMMPLWAVSVILHVRLESRSKALLTTIKKSTFIGAFFMSYPISRQNIF